MPQVRGPFGRRISHVSDSGADVALFVIIGLGLLASTANIVMVVMLCLK
jgi:hypothetical protein